LKVFLLSVAFAAVFAIAAEAVMTRFVQTPSEERYASTTARP